MGIHKNTHVRRYSDEVIAQIEHLAWLEGKGPKAIAGQLGMPVKTVQNLMQDYAISAPRVKRQRPQFKSLWDFKPDELVLPHGY